MQTCDHLSRQVRRPCRRGQVIPGLDIPPRATDDLRAQNRAARTFPMTQTYRPLAAALWMMGSIAGFSLVAVAGRALPGKAKMVAVGVLIGTDRKSVV